MESLVLRGAVISGMKWYFPNWQPSRSIVRISRNYKGINILGWQHDRGQLQGWMFAALQASGWDVCPLLARPNLDWMFDNDDFKD
ncbi:hypothetical protein GOBAR_AA26596 [Gossypium barbadense]|uniref:Uncharacterized protein n=1 Tax=Gossypium barbadense TaxID=3634 RepID=A0A2P5WSK5_GOSBA|nr:hypothetical protein GOBAR_AA26596 [Gossypium barbadense]